MIKVLLADDNKLSLQYFSELIRWEDYGFQLVSRAVDGEEAWRDFQTFHPQVVIADIQMPILSGIQLAQKVLEAAPGTVFLFLSSYKEFQYARAALQLKVYDYLLKHETTENVLIKKLLEIKAHLGQETRKRQLLAREEAISLFLKPQRPDSPPPAPAFLTARYDCIYLELEHAFPFAVQQFAFCLSSSRKLPDRDLVSEYCAETFSSVLVILPLPGEQFLLITEPNDNPFDFCCALQRGIRKQFGISGSIVILQKNSSILECAALYERFRCSLTQIYFYPSGSIIEAAYLLPAQPCSLPEFPHWQDGVLPGSAPALLEQQFHLICAAKDYSAFCHTAVQWLNLLLSYDRHLVDPSSGQIISMFTPGKFPQGFEVDAMYQFIRDNIEELIAILSRYPIQEFSPQIREAIFLISQHYGSDNLTVEWIAEKLRISSSSLNALFKKETGFTPWKVIVNTRLKQARLLLTQGYSPNEVYLQTGYSSLSYFSKAFKKAYGISPQEWKRRYDYETHQA